MNSSINRRFCQAWSHLCKGTIVLAAISAIGSPAFAQNNEEQLIEALQPCLSKGFNASSDCSNGFCYVLQGISGTINFPSKVALAANKLKSVSACIETCWRNGGCFTRVLIQAIKPFQNDNTQGAYNSTEAGIEITGKADFTSAFDFDCKMKALTSVSRDQSVGVSNWFGCVTHAHE